MRIVEILTIVLCLTWISLGFSLAWAGPPSWRGSNPSAGASPGSPLTTTPQRFELQCPSAYTGIKGELLPTYWEPVDKGQRADFLKSQIQDQYLYCVYQVSSSSREIHASVRRLIPGGYSCASDGAGRFECREGNTQNTPRR